MLNKPIIINNSVKYGSYKGLTLAEGEKQVGQASQVKYGSYKGLTLFLIWRLFLRYS